MELSAARSGPYVRALVAALDALAPNEDHVPLSAARDHLHALDPALSGDLLLPGEASERTGMPAYAWMERAVSEAVLARQGRDETDPSEAELRRASSLDAALGRRMRDRVQLHRHLRRAELLPTTRLGGVVRRLGERAELAIAYDRMAPDGRWVRVRAELRLPDGARQGGPLLVDEDGRLAVDDSLQHFLTRHFATPLLVLWGQLGDACACEVFRLSRSWLGPFWFPGVRLPEQVPAALGSGLLLHASTEVIGEDIRVSRHLDPWLDPPKDERVPYGYGLFRQRRFAATARVRPACEAWAAERGMRHAVVPVGGPRPRRL